MVWQVIKMNDEVIVRFVRDDGEEFLVDETDWGALSIDGAAAPEYAIYTEDNAAADGASVIGKQVKARNLEIEAAVMSTAYNEILRGKALSFFNPKRTYKVYLTYMGRTRWISAELLAFKAPNARIQQRQTFSAFFLCPGSYWQSVDDFGKDIAAETPRWGFPYMDNPTYGTLVSVYNFDRAVAFDYDGDVPGYPVYTLTASDKVRNPKITKDGAFVRLLLTMQAGDVIHISTAPGQMRVTQDGVGNILQKVDRTSQISGLRMQPGANTVRYEADYGDNALHVVINYNKQYLGV